MHSYLPSIKKQFKYYKSLGDKTFAQVTDEQLLYQCNGESNSIAIIVKHIAGNMLSRWTSFLTTDGEKEWRDRDDEFIGSIKTRVELLTTWEKGWECLFSAIDPLTEDDLDKEVFIRNMGHTVIEAIHRQLAHYSYHIGQIVFIGKLVTNDHWESLSIPKGNSKTYNTVKFNKPKRTKHFTDDL